MDDRIWTLLAVGALFFVLNKLDEATVNHKKETSPPLLLEALLFPFTLLILSVVSGGIVYLLWGLVAPTLNLPSIDLLTAIALRWLATALFHILGTAHVKVVGDPT